MSGTRDRSIAVRLFLTAWIVYGLHFATNVVREHYPAFSLAERGTLRVDPYLGLHPDLFEIPGRGVFINNNPGASILAALPYAIVRPAIDRVVARIDRARAGRSAPLTHDYADPRPNRRGFFRKVRERGLDVRFGLAIAAIHALGVAPLTAASVVVMRGLLLRAGLGASAGLWLALLFAFGTPVFYCTATLNHNLLVAHASLFAFALLYRPGRSIEEPLRLVTAGLLLGTTLLCDYVGVISIAVLGGYALVVLRGDGGPSAAARGALWLSAGGAVPVAGLLAYQAWAFGDPLFPAQRYMPDTELSVVGWHGLSWPSLELVARNLFDPRFGLFAFGPILLLGFAASLPGVRLAPVIAKRERALVLVFVLALLTFCSANQYARLQWNTGFRMLAPVVPFLFLLTAATLTRLPRLLAVALGAVSIGYTWCLAMVREDVFASVTSVLRDGPTLPWLTVLRKMGDQYLPVALQTTGVAWLTVSVLALTVAVIWWPRTRRSAPL